jgi:hypothetical protein
MRRFSKKYKNYKFFKILILRKLVNNCTKNIQLVQQQKTTLLFSIKGVQDLFQEKNINLKKLNK